MYQVIFTKSAEKELSKLPKDIVSKIVDTIEVLANNPREMGYKNW